MQARDPAQALRAVTAPEVVLDAGTWLYVRLRPLDGTSRFSRGQPALRGIAHALGWGQIHLLLKSDAGGTSWVAMRAAVWAGAMANP